MLYYKDDEHLTACKYCGSDRFKGGNDRGKNSPVAKMHYMPLIPRLHRLYASKTSAQHMVWHKYHATQAGQLTHPCRASGRDPRRRDRGRQGASPSQPPPVVVEDEEVVSPDRIQSQVVQPQSAGPGPRYDLRLNFPYFDSSQVRPKSQLHTLSGCQQVISRAIHGRTLYFGTCTVSVCPPTTT